MYASQPCSIVQVLIDGKFVRMSLDLFKKRYQAGFHKGNGYNRKKGKK